MIKTTSHTFENQTSYIFKVFYIDKAMGDENDSFFFRIFIYLNHIILPLFGHQPVQFLLSSTTIDMQKYNLQQVAKKEENFFGNSLVSLWEGKVSPNLKSIGYHSKQQRAHIQPIRKTCGGLTVNSLLFRVVPYWFPRAFFEEFCNLVEICLNLPPFVFFFFFPNEKKNQVFFSDDCRN